ncbi:hypothetical protein IWX78_000486 [Mycetocola sp. CAN_C7]|uniref:hypothetical protein n=1 Tax=Mycetocola sp. CAN_C7 TaxID=2787724 RepID=UPI0018CAF23D
MSRFGPLEARAGSLVLGDACGHHAELAASALLVRLVRDPASRSLVDDPERVVKPLTSGR